MIRFNFNFLVTGVISWILLSSSAVEASVWVSGAKTVNQFGVYGTEGQADPCNIPGSRWLSVSWSDSSGNLWLFGGHGYTSVGFGRLNDLWKYDLAKELWTWVGGSDTHNQMGIYGTQGEPNSANIPGGRSSGIAWIDSNDSLWLFGGYGYDGSSTLGWLNDLWKYDLDTGLWTWVDGSDTKDQAGVYGTQGEPNSANIPGSRGNSVSWIDGQGNFWLFGGYGYDNWSNLSPLNDLWEYDPSTGLWTWVSGSKSGHQFGTYGTQGQPNPANIPGARKYSVGWMDKNDNLWLFGGDGYTSDSSGWLNDLWKYNLDTRLWTWVEGSDTADQTGIYGTKGEPNSANMPGGRGECLGWIDGLDNLWLFGGYGYSVRILGDLNDLWKYELSTGMWTWVIGSDTTDAPGMYGDKGVADSNNIPGARHGGISWMGDRALWLFGGYGYDSSSTLGWLNDLWILVECDNIPGDINRDCVVNFFDFAIMGDHWLEKGEYN